VPPSIILAIPALPSGVPSARSAITQLCEQLEIEDERTEDIRLAVTEACANCVLHSHTAQVRQPTFVLDAHVEDHALVVSVRDFGGGLQRAPLETRGLGLGLELIERLADSAQVASRPGGGVRVTMRFAMA
jgi:anti-sigma regulatory factor (Ser/Thr protein kinase)